MASPISAPPAPTRRRRRGCGCGCLPILLIVVLAVAGLIYLGVSAQASTTPGAASLTVFSPAAEVSRSKAAYASAATGSPLLEGDSVRTGPSGFAAVTFPDGSSTRLAPTTELALNTAQLSKDGHLSRVTLDQVKGRTLSNVQTLLGGGTYTITGHSASATVRGTQFEVLLRPDGSVLIQLFQGGLVVTGAGGQSVTLAAGQQTTVSAQGVVAKASPLQPDPADPFTLQRAALSGQTGNPGSAQSAAGTVASGQTVQGPPYLSPGGNLSAVLAYPGSLMRLTITDPNGVAHAATSAPPVKLTIPNGAPGLYQVAVTGLDLPAAGEPYFVTITNDLPCTAPDVDTPTVVRHSLDPRKIAQQAGAAGISGLSVSVTGASSGGAIVSGSVSAGGIGVKFTGVIYAAPPNLSALPTSVQLSGLNVNAQQASQAANRVLGHPLTEIPIGFSVDRLYSCSGVLVVEGHR